MSRKPFLASGTSIGAEADAVLGCLRVIKEYRDQFGIRGIGSLIISMTRGVADLLVMYLSAREVGLWVETSEGPACQLHVVPLFETIEDLEIAPAVVQKYLSNEFTGRSLALQREARKGTRLVQQVMLGYSDSNKDSGMLTSQWALHCRNPSAQWRIPWVCKSGIFTVEAEQLAVVRDQPTVFWSPCPIKQFAVMFG